VKLAVTSQFALSDVSDHGAPALRDSGGNAASALAGGGGHSASTVAIGAYAASLDRHRQSPAPAHCLKSAVMSQFVRIGPPRRSRRVRIT
jgi:hypothetical protein